MTDVADHQARRDAALALEKIAAHERFCEERARKSEIFESEVRIGLKEMNGTFREGVGRIHMRLDDFQKKGFWTAVGIVSSVAIGLAFYLIQQQGGG